MDPVTAMTLAGMGLNLARSLLSAAQGNPKTTPEQQVAISALLIELTVMVDKVEAVEIRDVG